MADAPAMRELLGEDAPSNWGRWGSEDQLGCLNYLDAKEVLRGAQHIRTGDVFTLQIQMGRKDSPGDPLWPGRSGIERQNMVTSREVVGVQATDRVGDHVRRAIV